MTDCVTGVILPHPPERSGMSSYEKPEIVASYSIEELIEEAASCTEYGKTTYPS